MMNHKKHINKFSEYVLHSSNSKNKLNFEEI